MRMPDAGITSMAAPPQLNCPPGDQKQELIMKPTRARNRSTRPEKMIGILLKSHRLAAFEAIFGAIPGTVQDVLRSPGQPLEGATRFESRFGYNEACDGRMIDYWKNRFGSSLRANRISIIRKER